MAKLILKLDESYTIYAGTTFSCTRTSTALNDHADSFSGTYSGSTEVIFNTSKIPAGASITSVKFVKNPDINGNRGGSLYYTITSSGSSATDDNILKLLKKSEENKQPFHDLSITLKISISTSGYPSHSIPSTLYATESKDYSRSATYTSENTYLEIDYIDPIDITQPSPTIINFSIRDTFKRDGNESFQVMAYRTKSIGEKKSGDSFASISHQAEPINNCFFQNYSNLIFSIESATSFQPVDTLYYSLTIKKTVGENKGTVYEKLNSLESIFNLGPEIFSNEDTPNFYKSENDEESFSYQLYDFYYTVSDISNNGTQIYGTIYLIPNYSPPIISNFSVNRFGIYQVIEDGDISYEDKESSDGEFLITNLSSTIKKIPYKIISKEEELSSISYNFLSYKKTWTSDDPDKTVSDKNFSQVYLTDNATLNLSQNTTFLSGEKIKNVNMEPEYEYSYSANYNYTITVEIKDICLSAIASAEILPAFSYLNIELGGVAIGERHPGTTEADSNNPTFLVNLPTTFKKQIILLEGFSYGEAEPSTIFTGENEETNPSPVEGQIYFKLL